MRVAGFVPASCCPVFCLHSVQEPAWACEPPDPSRVPVDRPITVYSDGSFADASEDDDWNFLVGQPVRDLRGGRVGQVIEQDAVYCEVLQRLLVVDCTTGEAFLVHGLPPENDNIRWPGEHGGPWDWPAKESTRALQAAGGPLPLTAATTVAEIRAIAAQECLTVADVPGMVADMKPRNRYAPFLGCRIFYPGSRQAER